MLAFAIRRAVWALPTLFGVSLVVFLLTTLLPDPVTEADLAAAKEDVLATARLEELRRARFLDLPRFVNPSPRDVSSRIDECLAHLAADDASAAFCGVRLAQMGGAALPFLIPRLDNLPPAARGRVALALVPVAHRMGLESTDLATPERAALFWSRFWDDRSVDFTEPAVRRAVSRLVQRGTELREQDVVLVDTFALREVMDAMRATKDIGALVRLTRVAARVTSQAGPLRELPEGADRETARAVVSAWASWWFVHETDYVALRGGEKVAASISQTRYAKWMLGAVTGQLGLSTRDGLPLVDKLIARAPTTLGMALLGLLLGLAAAVPLGVLSAWQRGRAVDHVIGGVMLVLYALPTFLVAEVLRVRAGLLSGLVLPVLALATVAVAATTQQQRAAMIEALTQDYVRVARAKGARTLRALFVHALRNALVPTITLAGVQFPALLGAAFVVEEVWGIRGMGWETLRAIESRDVAWIASVTLLCAVVTTAGLVMTDLAYGVLDPRVRESQAGSRRG